MTQPTRPSTARDRREGSSPGRRESVWEYPRPPRLEPVCERLRVMLAGEILAETTRGWRVVETGLAPSYYFPPTAVRRDLLVPATGRSLCEFKGLAHYWSVELRGRRVERVAWSFPEPADELAAIAEHFAFYPAKVDACWLGDERARPQEGELYGGWVTGRIVGPFRADPPLH